MKKKDLNRVTSTDETLIEVSCIPPKAQSVTSTSITWYNSKLGSTDVALPRQMVGTNLTLTGLDGSSHAMNLNTRWYTKEQTEYSYDEFLLDGTILGDLVACGLGANILNGWVVPKKYLTLQSRGNYMPDSEDIGGIYNAVSGREYLSLNITLPSTCYCYNAKGRYGQSVTTYVYNPGSGAVLQKAVTDVINTNGDSGIRPTMDGYTAEGYIGADITPNGSPVFAWTYYNGKFYQLGNPIECLRGSQWKKTAIIAQGVSGSALQANQLNTDRQMLGIDTGISMASGAATAMYGAGTLNGIPYAAGISQVVGAVGNYASQSIKIQQQLDLLNAQCITSAIPIQRYSSEFLRDTDNNNFYTMISHYDAADMRSFDEFLTRYGYNVGNLGIQKAHFWCRPSFVFVQVNSITIKSPYAGSELLDKVATQLKAGVRIWRVAPNKAAMERNGNR